MISKVHETMEQCWCKYKMAQPHWKTMGAVSVKLNVYLTCRPNIPNLGIYTRKMKTYVHVKPHINLYSNFITASGWE